MKIILSGSGGGKTTKVAELMAELSHKGEESLVISGELDFVEFKEYAIRAEADLDKLRYTHAINFDDIVKAVADKEDERVRTIFIDTGCPIVIPEVPKGEATDYILEMLSEVEISYKKSIYVTLQTNIDNKRLNGEKLVVIDYERETAK